MGGYKGGRAGQLFGNAPPRLPGELAWLAQKELKAAGCKIFHRNASSICLCLPGLFRPAFTLILRACYSADIGINTASSCDGPTLFVTEVVAGNASISLT